CSETQRRPPEFDFSAELLAEQDDAAWDLELDRRNTAGHTDRELPARATIIVDGGEIEQGPQLRALRGLVHIHSSRESVTDGAESAPVVQLARSCRADGFPERQPDEPEVPVCFIPRERAYLLVLDHREERPRHAPPLGPSIERIQPLFPGGAEWHLRHVEDP